MSNRAEFPIQIDRESYVIPTVGIAAVASTPAAAVAMVVGASLTGHRDDWIEMPLIAAWVIFASMGSATWWIRRRWRIHHERKIVVDDRGVTYVAFAGKERLMRWSEIQRAEEREEYGQGEGTSMVYRLKWRSFRVRDCEYPGFGEIRRLTQQYLPDRTSLLAR